jgi:DNA-binding phage protein
MVKRGADWNEGLAEDLRDPEFAREFLLAAVEEGIAVQKALSKVIRAMGVKEYAAMAGIASSNMLRAIRAGHNPAQATLDRMLRPFGLKLSVAPIERSKHRRAP